MKLTLRQARYLWSRAQGLTHRSAVDLDAVVADTGWIRTLGGAEAYLGLLARVRDVSTAAVGEALARRRLCVAPSVRGCIYLVSRADLGLSLRIAEALSARRNARDLERAGATTGELEGVGAAVLDVLEGGGLDTHGVKQALPDGVVRSLGEAGKKVGLSSTLPPALRALELSGRVVRRPLDDRLDHERYVWQLAVENPLTQSGVPDSPEAVHQALAARFFSWGGPDTRAAFAAWSGLGQRDAAAAIARVGLREVEVESLGEAFVPESALVDVPSDPPEPEHLNWLPALDNLFGLRERAAPLVDAEHADVEVAFFGRQDRVPISQASMPLDRTLARGGRIVALWGWDPDEGDVEARFFAGERPPKPDRFEVERIRVRDLLRDLGHGRAMVLDNDDSLRERLQRIRGVVR